jgi:hypothetical protein
MGRRMRRAKGIHYDEKILIRLRPYLRLGDVDGDADTETEPIEMLPEP